MSFYRGLRTPLEIPSALYRRLRSEEISQDELSFCFELTLLTLTKITF